MTTALSHGILSQIKLGIRSFSLIEIELQNGEISQVYPLWIVKKINYGDHFLISWKPTGREVIAITSIKTASLEKILPRPELLKDSLEALNDDFEIVYPRDRYFTYQSAIQGMKYASH